MKKGHAFFVMLLVLGLLCACVFLPNCGGSKSDDDSDDENGTTETGFKVTGSVSGTARAAEAKAAATFTPPADRAALYYDDTAGRTGDDASGGVSATLSPESYTVALKRLTLLGEDSSGTADYEVFSTTDVSTAYIADFVNDTTFFDSDTYPPAGTYEGIEIEVFYIEMDIPLVIPRISWDEDVYTTRGYFHEVGNCEPRDVTILYDQDGDGVKEEYWINRKMDDPQPFSLVAVTETHIFQVLDLWSDEDFWGTESSPRTPLTINTTAEFSAQYGTDFHFELAPGTESFTIPENPEGIYEIAFQFDVHSKFTWWEYLCNASGTVATSNADGMFAVGFDIGYRIMFPDVIISAGEAATETK